MITVHVCGLYIHFKDLLKKQMLCCSDSMYVVAVTEINTRNTCVCICQEDMVWNIDLGLQFGSVARDLLLFI